MRRNCTCRGTCGGRPFETVRVIMCHHSYRHTDIDTDTYTHTERERGRETHRETGRDRERRIPTHGLPALYSKNYKRQVQKKAGKCSKLDHQSHAPLQVCVSVSVTMMTHTDSKGTPKIVPLQCKPVFSPNTFVLRRASGCLA